MGWGMGVNNNRINNNKAATRSMQFYAQTDTLTWGTGEAMTSKQVYKVCRCYVQVDVLEVQQHRKPEGSFKVPPLTKKMTDTVTEDNYRYIIITIYNMEMPAK